MPSLDKNTQAFLTLVRAGLWEKEAQLSQYGSIDFNEILRLTEEQSVVGLVSAGLEHVCDIKVPKEVALQFVGSALQLEQRNLAMNDFVAKLIEYLRKEDVYAILVKGQGLAQCYERPMWRASGDIDLLLSEDNYNKAVKFLTPKASTIEEEIISIRHKGMVIDSWVVELHGTMRCRLWKKVDRIIDETQKEVFFGGSVRSWLNGNTQVFIPRADEDVIFVFSHVLQHFYRDGIGLRQVCDWCRLLWVFKDRINQNLLNSRLKRAGVMTEWKTFAAFVVDYLGMPTSAMPFYSDSLKWKRKAKGLFNYIISTGSFGYNRDKSYYSNKPFIYRKTKSFLRNTADGLRQMTLFPIDASIVWTKKFFGGLANTAKGIG